MYSHVSTVAALLRFNHQQYQKMTRK